MRKSMHWTVFSSWLQLFDELRSWIFRLEPEFLHSNALVHTIFVFIAVKIALSLIILMVSAIVILIYLILLFTASIAARLSGSGMLIYDLISPMAYVCVQVESIIVRLITPLVDIIGFADDGDHSIDDYEKHVEKIRDPKPLGLPSRIA